MSKLNLGKLNADLSLFEQLLDEAVLDVALDEYLAALDETKQDSQRQPAPIPKDQPHNGGSFAKAPAQKRINGHRPPVIWPVPSWGGEMGAGAFDGVGPSEQKQVDPPSPDPGPTFQTAHGLVRFFDDGQNVFIQFPSEDTPAYLGWDGHHWLVRRSDTWPAYCVVAGLSLREAFILFAKYTALDGHMDDPNFLVWWS